MLVRLVVCQSRSCDAVSLRLHTADDHVSKKLLSVAEGNILRIIESIVPERSRSILSANWLSFAGFRGSVKFWGQLKFSTIRNSTGEKTVIA